MITYAALSNLVYLRVHLGQERMICELVRARCPAPRGYFGVFDERPRNQAYSKSKLLCSMSMAGRDSMLNQSPGCPNHLSFKCKSCLPVGPHRSPGTDVLSLYPKTPISGCVGKRRAFAAHQTAEGKCMGRWTLSWRA